MAFNFDETNPTDSSFIADFPSNERAQRLAVLSSLTIDHDPEGEGEHVKVSLQPRALAPVLNGTAGFLYTKEISDITELFYEDENAKEIQLTSDGSASPDKLPLGGGTMTGDVTFDSGNILMEGTSELRLLNAKYVQGRDVGDANWRDLVGVDDSDVSEFGDVNLGGGLRLLADDVDEAVVEYGSGDKKIWHAGHFADPPVATQIYELVAGITLPTGAGDGSVTHAIGVRPGLWIAYMECTSGEEGYNVGDEVTITGGYTNAGTPRELTVFSNETQFLWRKPQNEFRFLKAGGSGSFDIDVTKWELKFRAWY